MKTNDLIRLWLPISVLICISPNLTAQSPVQAPTVSIRYPGLSAHAAGIQKPLVPAPTLPREFIRPWPPGDTAGLKQGWFKKYLLNTPAGPYLLAGSGVFGGLCGVFVLISGQNYKNYKKPANTNRKADYNTANNQHHTAIVSGCVALACLVGCGIIIYDSWKDDNDDKNNTDQLNSSIRLGQDAQLHFVYHF